MFSEKTLLFLFFSILQSICCLMGSSSFPMSARFFLSSICTICHKSIMISDSKNSWHFCHIATSCIPLVPNCTKLLSMPGIFFLEWIDLQKLLHKPFIACEHNFCVADLIKTDGDPSHVLSFLQYDNFLLEHGGSSNAFTETEYTCYYFDVMQSYFKDCLDRWATSKPRVKTITFCDNHAYYYCTLYLTSATNVKWIFNHWLMALSLSLSLSLWDLQIRTVLPFTFGKGGGHGLGGTGNWFRYTASKSN